MARCPHVRQGGRLKPWVLWGWQASPQPARFVTTVGCVMYVHRSFDHAVMYAHAVEQSRAWVGRVNRSQPLAAVRVQMQHEPRGCTIAHSRLPYLRPNTKLSRK